MDGGKAIGLGDEMEVSLGSKRGGEVAAEGTE